MSSTYGYVTKLFLESEFQHKGNKQTKKQTNANSQQNLAVSWQEQIQKIKLFNYYTEKDKNTWATLSSLGQEPTFKVCLIFNYIYIVFKLR